MRVSEGRRSFFEKKEPKKLLISVGVEGSRFGRSEGGGGQAFFWFRGRRAFLFVLRKMDCFASLAMTGGRWAGKAWMPACVGMTGETDGLLGRLLGCFASLAMTSGELAMTSGGLGMPRYAR